MPEESPYAKLGDVEPVNLLQFAHQIAAGMVCCLHIIIVLRLTWIVVRHTSNHCNVEIIFLNKAELSKT